MLLTENQDRPEDVFLVLPGRFAGGRIQTDQFAGGVHRRFAILCSTTGSLLVQKITQCPVPINQKHPPIADRDGVMADRTLGVVPPLQLAALGIHHEERFRLGEQAAHVRRSPGMFHDMLFVDQRTKQQSVLAGDVSPQRFLAVGMRGGLESAQHLSGCGIQSITDALAPHVNTVATGTEITACPGYANDVVSVVSVQHAGKSEFPQRAAIVGIHAAESVHPLHEQTTTVEQRRGSPPMPTGQFQVHIVEPQDPQRPLDGSGRAEGVGRRRVLVGPGSGIGQSLPRVKRQIIDRSDGHNSTPGPLQPSCLRGNFRGVRLSQKCSL